jgi:hypothetical protein
MDHTFRVSSLGIAGGLHRPHDMGMMSLSTMPHAQAQLSSAADNPDSASAQAQPSPFIPVHYNIKEFVKFSDATVSRKHFDITYGAGAGGGGSGSENNAHAQAPTTKTTSLP